MYYCSTYSIFSPISVFLYTFQLFFSLMSAKWYLIILTYTALLLMRLALCQMVGHMPFIFHWFSINILFPFSDAFIVFSLSFISFYVKFLNLTLGTPIQGLLTLPLTQLIVTECLVFAGRYGIL